MAVNTVMISTYMQNSSGTPAGPGVLQMTPIRLAKAPSITRQSPAQGFTLVLCYKGFGQTPFFPKETQHSSLTYHKVQIRITFLDNELGCWPQAQLLGLSGEAYNSLEICPEHTLGQERGKRLLPIQKAHSTKERWMCQSWMELLMLPKLEET